MPETDMWEPAPVPPPPQKPIQPPLNIGGATRRSGQAPGRPSLQTPAPSGTRPTHNLFQRPLATAMPPEEEPVLPPGFVEPGAMPTDPNAPPNFHAALPELPPNWNAILQALGFFSGLSGGSATELPTRLRKDPLANLR